MVQEISTASNSKSVNITNHVTNHSISHRAMIRRVVSGAFLGLAWGAALRSWMVLMAMEFGDRPEFTWQGTFIAILVPAALMGATLGWGTYVAETSGGKRWRWTILSPLLLIFFPAIALDDFISALITTGLGGGAIAVALTGMLGGYAFSGLGATWLRWISGLLSIFLSLGMAYGIYFVNSTMAVAPATSEIFGLLFYVLLMALLLAGISQPSRYQSKQHISS